MPSMSIIRVSGPFKREQVQFAWLLRKRKTLGFYENPGSRWEKKETKEKQNRAGEES